MKLPHGPSYGRTRQIISPAALGLIACPVFYNAVLASLNAIGVHQSYTSVAVTEMMIIGTTAVYVAASGIQIILSKYFYIIIFGIMITIYVSFASQAFILDCARAATIIGLFMIMGSAATEQQVFGIFRIFSIATLSFLIVEIIDTELYVKIFQPAAYYSATRGIEEFSLDSSGLFRNALGFQGRFSFNLSSHRTSSIFIEQVSLANFSGVLIIYVLAVFERLRPFDRWLHIATIILIILTNDSRTSSSFAVMGLIGAYAFPRIPHRLVYFVMPLVIVIGCTMVQLHGLTRGDDLQGRVSLTIANLSNLDWKDWLGLGGRQLSGFMDSGYAYVVAGSTIFGLLILWLLLVHALPAATASQRRCLFGLNIFMCTNLMIGGTAVFSIKIGAPLWLLVGYMGTYNFDTLLDRQTSTPFGQQAILASQA